MNASLPKTLSYCGRQINFAGKGRDRGSYLYLDNAFSKVHEILVAVVEKTGPMYSLARAQDSESVGVVRVDHELLNGSGRPQVGDILLVGPLQYMSTGPKAQAAWRARVEQPKQTSRHTGMITEVHPSGSYGRVTAERIGKRVFVHHSQLRNGARLAVGQRVVYMEVTNDRGPMAIDVRPA